MIFLFEGVLKKVQSWTKHIDTFSGFGIAFLNHNLERGYIITIDGMSEFPHELLSD